MAVTQQTRLHTAHQPVKPDLRSWLLVVLCVCAVTATLGSDLGFVLLTAWALLLYAVFGEARRVPLLIVLTVAGVLAAWLGCLWGRSLSRRQFAKAGIVADSTR